MSYLTLPRKKVKVKVSPLLLFLFFFASLCLFCVSRNKIYLCLVFFFPFLFRFFFILVTFYLFILCALLQHHQPVQSVCGCSVHTCDRSRISVLLFELIGLSHGWMGWQVGGLMGVCRWTVHFSSGGWRLALVRVQVSFRCGAVRGVWGSGWAWATVCYGYGILYFFGASCVLSPIVVQISTSESWVGPGMAWSRDTDTAGDVGELLL